MSTNTNNRGMSFTNAIASILCIGMLGAVVIPGLSELKQRVEPTICSNNLKSCVQGWNLYASVSNGKWPARWDWDNNHSAATQVPYIMWYFTKGEIPAGACFDSDLGGWWNPDTHQYGDFWPTKNHCSDNPVYHCPTTIKQDDWETPFPRHLTSYTHASDSFYVIERARWEYLQDHYAQPELFTHSSTTVRIFDLAGSKSETVYNGWSGHELIKTYNPHDGKGNYAFCDGHVELLTNYEFYSQGDQMFKPYFTGQEEN